ncbi:trimethyllysine dioxygenase [Candidatus Pseudothioglobus singularis]|jgi:trimethyllysine dioxygenase|nr:trimethyllysine dioxygenase [Candidatus Pseudothioglobus singularis]
MSIQSIRPKNSGLNIMWEDGSSSCFPWLWIRDHSESEVDLHPDSKQRQIDVFSKTLDNSIVDVILDHNTKNIVVQWSDKSNSHVSFELLKSLASTSIPSAQALDNDSCWNSSNEMDNFPEMSYSDFMSENGLQVWLKNIHRVGFVLVTGSPETPEATQELMERTAYVRNSIFGGFSVWDNKLENPDDTAFTSLAIEPHTDGTYVHDAPGLQTLHCLKRDSTGGENQLVDGLAIAEKMRIEYPVFFKILTNINIPGRYIKTDTYLEAKRPLFRVNDEEKVVQVSFNNHDRAPFRLDNQSMNQFYEAYKIFHNLANDKNRQFQFMLEPGTVLTFDNWRVLHARSALTGYRQLCGGYHNHEDFESKLRLI